MEDASTTATVQFIFFLLIISTAHSRQLASRCRFIGLVSDTDRTIECDRAVICPCIMNFSRH